MEKPRVAILGLGIMGSGMTARLLSANFPLVVYNRDRQKASPVAAAGARVAASPREAASSAEIVISMVADDVASRAVWFGSEGALSGVSPGSVLLECSTLTVEWVKELAAAAREVRCELLDAPVTGTKPHAASGELRFLVGGSASALATAMPVLSVLGRDVLHLGPNGSGAQLKLINNFLCGVQAASLAEAESLIAAAGLDREKALAILTNGAPASPLVKTLAVRVASGDPTINFSLRLMAKDLSYALKEAQRSGVTLKTAKAALEGFNEAIATGHGDEDFSAIIKAQRQK